MSLWAKVPRCLLRCKSFRRCLVTSLLSQAFERECITGRGKPAVSSAFHLCLNDKMEEELSSIWTVLIVAGLSVVLQAKRFSSGADEEKHTCHNSSGLLNSGWGLWIEALGWWGYVVQWLLPSLAPWHPSEDYRQKNPTALHCNMPWWCLKRALGGLVSLRHGHHNSYCLSSEQNMIYTPSLPVQMCSMPSSLKCQDLFSQTLW